MENDFPYGSSANAEKKPLKGTLIHLLFDSRTTLRAIIALVLVAACLVILFVSWKTARNRPFLKTSVTQKFFADKPEIQTESTKALTSAADAYQKAVSEHKEELLKVLTPEEYQKIERISQLLRNCAEDLTLENVEKLSDGVKDLRSLVQAKGSLLPKEYQETYKNHDIGLPNLSKILNAINFVQLYGMLICMALCLLGGILRLKGLVGLSLSFSLIHNLLFAGFFLALLTLAVHTALRVVLRQLKRQCKKSMA